jgi:hypothetical protein
MAELFGTHTLIPTPKKLGLPMQIEKPGKHTCPQPRILTTPYTPPHPSSQKPHSPTPGYQ